MISVGNLVVGGSGKTPVVAALARLLQGLGERPAILSRGYARRRQTAGVLVVSDGQQVLAAVEESGDEPQMLARTLSGVPVLVARERYAAGRLAEQRFDATVLILDDGYQHLRLARTVDLLIVAPQDLDDRVLPSGRLREPLSAARDADGLLVYGSRAAAERMSVSLGVTPAFTVAPRYGALQPLAGSSNGARRVVAVAGIARPARFVDALRQQGYDVASELIFPDHHWFTASDAARVVSAAHEARADAVVTTAKDAVRIERLIAAAPVPWAVLPIDVVVEPEEAFTAWLGERIGRWRGAHSS